VPNGVVALPKDIFTSKVFYADESLWSDKRYYRCNSPAALEAQWGALEAPIVGDHPPESGAWGYCDRDYPRKEIVSPYPFKTAQAHYEALLAEARKHGGPTQYTQATLPDWNGFYKRRRGKTETWYNGHTLQVPTYLSLLTPKYQRYFVQEMYHNAHTNAAQWPGSYCWPEGFMRRFAAYGGGYNVRLVMTPDMILDLRGGGAGVKNFITQIQMGRQFDMSGPVPRLGPDVPQWYGETIGFWDRDALITWTSNIQGWMAHGAFEFSNQIQSIEIYTAIHDARGKLVGIHHEAIIYDSEALVEPVRIVHILDRASKLNEGDPYVYNECIQHIFPIDGKATQMSSGSTFQYTVPDIYDRPWAKIWEKYYEKDMNRPHETGPFGL